MKTTEFWKMKLNSGGPIVVPTTEVIQAQWYDGLVLGYIATPDGLFVIVFVSESAERQIRCFFGYLLSCEKLVTEDDKTFLRSWLSRATTNEGGDSDEYETATARLLNLRTQATDGILIEADPAFGKILRSVIVPKVEIEKHWLGLEDFYTLSEDARRLRHKQLVQLIGESS